MKEKTNISSNDNTLLKADIRRLFTTSRLWIFLFICLLSPVLILTMTSGFGGEGAGMVFSGTWDLIGSVGGEMGMDMSVMMNINLLYFVAGIFICLFVADDFRSGYSKNLFTIRAKKSRYVLAKTMTGIIAGALMLITFFIGTVIGGAISGLPFALGTTGIFNLAMCMIAKVLLMGVMIPIFVTVASFGRGRSWLSILISMIVGMFLFMIIPMVSPLNSGPMNVLLSLAGAAMFMFGMGSISTIILKKSDLV